MKSIRRRAADSRITWPSAGSNLEYRVVIHNLDTGHLEIIYRGFQTECRLPADMRLLPDQLAYRVVIRDGDDPTGPYRRYGDFEVVPRLGDDYETPAADLLTAPPVKGVSQYRLVVTDKASNRSKVDMARPEPRFLLPAGQLGHGEFFYDIRAKVDGRWRKGAVHPITPEMIAAAEARAARLVTLPDEGPPVIQGKAAKHRPGRADRLAAVAAENGPGLLIAVDVTAAPHLAPVADPEQVAARQWWSGDGQGAAEAVALALESHGLKGLFMLDVLAGEMLGETALLRLAGALTERGHTLGVLINSAPFAARDAQDPGRHAKTVRAAVKSFLTLTGAPPAAVSFTSGSFRRGMVGQIGRAGVPAILMNRDEQLTLPAWMRWRTAPFAAYDNLAVLPATMLVSTPAHVRDRSVRHTLGAGDPLASAIAAGIVEAMSGGPRRNPLLTVRIDSLDLLLRRKVRSVEKADRWNQSLASLPVWQDAGWRREPRFIELGEQDEIRKQMMTGLIAGLAAGAVPVTDPRDVLSPEALRSWAQPEIAYDPLIEQRRGPRKIRQSAVRRYDAALLQALKEAPA